MRPRRPQSPLPPPPGVAGRESSGLTAVLIGPDFWSGLIAPRGHWLIAARSRPPIGRRHRRLRERPPTDRVRLASSSPAPPAARPSAVCPAAAPWSPSGRKPILERWRQIGRAEVALPPRRAGERPRPSDGRPGGRALSLLSWKGKPSSAPRRAAGRESSSEKDRERKEEGRRRKGSAKATTDEARRQRPRGLEETGLPRRRCKTGEWKTFSTTFIAKHQFAP